MARIVGIVGSSGSGKTTLAETLVEELRSRDLHVGYLEHAHKGFDVDGPATDSGRLRAAGADPVAVVGPDEMFTLQSCAPGSGAAAPDRALTRLAGCDLVLVEGFHAAPWPKIRVTPVGDEPREATGPILADLTTDEQKRCSPHDLEHLVDTLTHRAGGDQVGDSDDVADVSVALTVDGEVVPLAGFATEIMVGTVLGMVGALKGVDQPRAVELTIRSSGPSALVTDTGGPHDGGDPPTGVSR